MANDFYTPEQAAVVAARLVKEDGFLSALVSQNFKDELLGAGFGGAPVSIKMPTTLIARTRSINDITSNIVLDEIAETRRTFNLDREHLYSAVPLSEADITLNIDNFSEQVLKPQAEAVADILEHRLASALLAVPITAITKADGADTGTDPDVVAFNPEDPERYFTAIRKQLRDNGVSSEGLNVVVGTAVYAALLDAKSITDVSQSGSTAALREAGVGRIRGFNIVESTRVPEGEILAFHKDAVTLITRAPAKPEGAAFGATVSAGGYSLRYLRDYDVMKTVDRSLVSTFAGVGILPTFSVKRDYSDRSVDVVELPNGGVLHLDTGL